MKDSKKRSRFTPQPSLSNSVLALLQDQLEAANRREQQLLCQLAEKDAQIRMVLEDKFFKPVLTERPNLPETNVRMELSEDVVRFPTEGDAKAIEAQQQEEKKTRESLDAELANIAEDHRAYHERHPELPVVEVLDDLAEAIEFTKTEKNRA
jgi:hypothetical protein